MGGGYKKPLPTFHFKETMIKIYETTNLCNTLTLYIPFGKAKVKIEFESGNVSRGKHALYYAQDPFRQKVLDGSEHLGKMYRLKKVIHEPGDEAVNAAPKNAAPSSALNEGAAAETPMAQEAPATEAEAQNMAEAPKPAAKGTTMKDVKFAEASEVIIFVMEQYGEQVEDLDAAKKLLRKHKINAVIG